MMNWVDAMRCDVDEGGRLLRHVDECRKWMSAEEVEMPSDGSREVSVNHVVGKGGRVLASDMSKD